MPQDKKQLALLVGILLFFAIAVISGVSNPRQTTKTPTLSISKVQTEAVATFASGLTSTAEAMPSSTPTGTGLALSPVAMTSTITPTPSCYNLHFVKDVTIPDNTPETPAQVFTKTWLVENSGTCAWQTGFKVVLVGGLAMGGSPFSLIQGVGPGGRIQISIKMVAPTDQKGIVQGTWRMSDETGVQFGEAMWVTIVVGNETGTPPTPTIIATP